MQYVGTIRHAKKWDTQDNCPLKDMYQIPVVEYINANWVVTLSLDKQVIMTAIFVTVGSNCSNVTTNGRAAYTNIENNELKKMNEYENIAKGTTDPGVDYFDQ